MSEFFLTTAINYTNGKPHLGHAYEVVIADFIARWHRLEGDNVFLLTGTDEHGQKIADTAKSQALSPIELCDKYVIEFKMLNQLLQINYTRFIRTTEELHKVTATRLWKLVEPHDIYLSEYRGWYSTREERFYTLAEAEAVNYLDGTAPLSEVSEPSYFFRLSKYQNKLIDHIEANSDFIYPPERRNEILERLKEPLLDLSISRTKVKWGIPIPDPGAEDHVMYVWFDALANYLSGVDALGIESGPSRWPADLHLIGKDIVWFHAVIWPCMLFSAGLPLPRQIICHGFINASDGRKMSKTWGNVVDPVEVIKKYGSDAFRFFCLSEGSFGSDINFSFDIVKERYNGELANNLGNLVQRTSKLAELYSESVVPVEAAEAIFNIDEVKTLLSGLVRGHQITKAVHKIFQLSAEVNGWITQKAPWKSNNEKEKRICVRSLAESLYILAHLLEPIIPTAAEEMFRRLGTEKKVLGQLSWSNLVPGAAIKTGEALFPR